MAKKSSFHIMYFSFTCFGVFLFLENKRSNIGFRPFLNGSLGYIVASSQLGIYLIWQDICEDGNGFRIRTSLKYFMSCYQS